MDLTGVASRVAAADPAAASVRVTEDPNTVTVEHLGKVHSGTWPEDADEGEWQDVVGDVNLLRAAMTAWNGEPSFEVSPQELSERGGGWWSVASGTAALSFELPDDDEEEEVDLKRVEKQVVAALSSVAKKGVLRLDDLDGDWTVESDGGRLFAVLSDGPAKKKFPVSVSVSESK